MKNSISSNRVLAGGKWMVLQKDEDTLYTFNFELTIIFPFQEK